MKNKKLLMPLAGVAALGAVSPIVVMATSCGEKADSSISKIEATSTKTSPYVGETIQKTDIQVVAYMTSGVIEDVDSSSWTCSEIGDAGYHFGTAQKKTFDIAYKGHHTQITFNATAYATLSFEQLVPLNLCKGASFATEEKLHVYASSQSQTEIHEIDLQALTIEVIEGKNNVEYNAELQTLVPLATTGTAKIRAKYTEAPDYYADLDVTLQNTSISDAEIDEYTGNAKVTIKEANYKSAATNYNFVKVPNYIKIGDTVAEVAEIAADENIADEIHTIYIPDTVTYIPADMFAKYNSLRNVYFNGTTRQWNRVNAGDNWAGAGCVGGYCIGQDEPEFVYFSGCQGSTFNSETAGSEFFMTEKAVGRADLINGHYTVDFDLARAYLAGITDFTKLTKIELINSARLPLGGDLEIESIYVDGVKMVTGSATATDDDYTDVAGSSLYKHEYTFTTNTGKGANRFTATSRIVIRFTTPHTSLNSVNVKLSFVNP